MSWVDTAAVYGLGHSEEVVGQVVREHGGEVLIFTKCGRPWYGREGNEPTYDLRPETIRFELEQSLKRLGTDHIDLYQFHWPDTETGTPVEDSWAAMAELVRRARSAGPGCRTSTSGCWSAVSGSATSTPCSRPTAWSTGRPRPS